MVEITWLGHSTFQLKLESGEAYVIDPWIEGNPKYPAGHEFTRVDAILASHGHGDHIGGMVPLAKKFSAKVVGIYEVCLFAQSQGVKDIAPMNMGGSQMVGPMKVTMTPAMHSSGIEDGTGRVIGGGDPAGYVLHFPGGRRAYFAGDTCVFGDMKLIGDLYHPDLCFLPIGDLYTMDPEQAALAVRLLRPKQVIPMHWGTFPPLTGRPEHLSEKIQGTGAEVWELTPGQPVRW